jgi:hypothetical protein
MHPNVAAKHQEADKERKTPDRDKGSEKDTHRPAGPSGSVIRGYKGNHG